MSESTGSVPLRIFMSYRRADTGWAAVSLFDRLADQFGRDKIFKDVDSIDFGEDFVQAITTAVGSSDALLALIGHQWLTVTDQNGRRRLDSSGDFVALQIEAALTRGVRIIPILIDGALMPREDQLPESLAPLVRRQALELNPDRFGSDFQRLLPVLNPDYHRGAAAAPPSREGRGAAAADRAVAEAASWSGCIAGLGSRAGHQRRAGGNLLRPPPIPMAWPALPASRSPAASRQRRHGGTSRPRRRSSSASATRRSTASGSKSSIPFAG